MSSSIYKRKKTIRFGCIGIRGYGQIVCEYLTRHHLSKDEQIQFVVASDPVPEKCTEIITKLKSVGVSISQDIDELLAMDIDAVWLPLPIHLHKEFTISALTMGKAVICEKPAAGCISDVDAMIDVRDATGRPVIVGFQHLYDPVVETAKRTLVSGRLGKARRAVVYGCWPRTRQYYTRTDWAGRMTLGQKIINDSPASNAMSHFIMLALFLLGLDYKTAATVKSVQSYLYRAAEIETYDTVSMRITTTDNIEIDIHLSHASQNIVTPTVRIYTEQGQLTMIDADRMVIERGKSSEQIPWNTDSRVHIAPTMAALLRNKTDLIHPASLENARQHVLACELASSYASVIDVSPSILKRGVAHQDGEGTAINDIEVMISECVRDGRLLSKLVRQE